MSYLYNLILHNPLLNALAFFYDTIAAHDLGLSIIFLTILIRLILFPLFQRITRHQLIMQELQPHLAKIKETHKEDMEKQAHATMELFKEHKVNPFAGFFLTFLQLPILIALYQIFRHIFDANAFAHLYSFVHAPETLGHTLLGLLNLQNPSILLVGLAAVLTYVQTRMSLPKPQPGVVQDSAAKMAGNMAFIGPILIAVIFYKLPSALSLYLVTTTVFSIIQQTIITRQLKHEKLERIRNAAGSQDGVERLQG
jgi:YidC/Oxa1 family membrane protein insertase